MKSLKILPLMLIALLGLVACGEKQENNADVKNVAIVQIIDNSAFAEMREGFINQMRANGYTEDKMKFHYKDAQGDASVLNTIAQEVTSGNYDFLVAIATPAAQALVNMESEKPTFFISIMDPLGSRIITDLQNPDKNSTGTSNEIPHTKIFELAKQLTPEVASYGLIYCPNEVNALSVIKAAKIYLDANNIPYKEAVVPTAGEAQQAAQSLIGSVDAIFVPVDSVLQSVMPSVAEVAVEAKKPLYGCSVTNVISGAFATLATEDSVLGAEAANMATKYLNGTAITDIPVEVVPATKLVINKKTADAIGIEIPADQGIILVNP